MKEAFPLDFRSKNKSIEATDYKGLDLMTLNFLLTLFSLLTFSTVFSFYYVLSLLKKCYFQSSEPFRMERVFDYGTIPDNKFTVSNVRS